MRCSCPENYSTVSKTALGTYIKIEKLKIKRVFPAVEKFQIKKHLS